jgi:hypothetical protein
MRHQMRVVRQVVFVACRKNHGQDISTMSDTIEACQALVDSGNAAEPEWAALYPVFEIIPIVEEFLVHAHASH